MSAALNDQTKNGEGFATSRCRRLMRELKRDGRLMFAVINMHAATVLTLLKFGADVNAQSEAGFTPLILAAGSGDARIASALLNSGADVRKTLRSGQTALSHAAEHGYNDIVELLKRAISRSQDVSKLFLKAEASRVC